jgi:hypothetical protein
VPILLFRIQNAIHRAGSKVDLSTKTEVLNVVLA